MYYYSCRCDPCRPHHGSLGGCCYGENESWRKKKHGSPKAEIVGDATICWPFAQYVALQPLGFYAEAA